LGAVWQGLVDELVRAQAPDNRRLLEKQRDKLMAELRRFPEYDAARVTGDWYTACGQLEAMLQSSARWVCFVPSWSVHSA
jgi:hypothetical protein